MRERQDVADTYIGPEELAAQLGIPLRTIYQWRHRGDYGPGGYKIGRHVRFKQSEVDAWINEQADPRPAA